MVRHYLLESLSIRPSTGKKQKRTSKGCVIKPTSAPNPIELTEPTKCRLTCVHDGVIFNVAEATVYPNEDDTELVHGTPLLVGNVRVSIDKVLEGTAPLPVPTEFLERVADAAGSFVQWPKELIVIGDKESLSITPSAPKKQKQTSKGSTIRPTSEPKIDDYISAIGPECKKLHDLLSLMVLEAKIFDVVLPSKVFFFETDKTIFVTEEDINQLLRMAFLNVSCIQLFMMYLQKHCEEKNEGSSSIAFLCPTIISQIGDDKELNNEVMKYVENSLYQMKNVGIVLVPFCQE
ncbi:uncharacterized protein LOC141608036 [Silene latifolia]|uniref:uncharacterized protein LOC141608036 n=1 Tax=Silene latifolia TaxID=37657 RepID=UPI003D7734F6